MRWVAERLRAGRADDGLITPMITVMVLSFILLIGLVVDSSVGLTAHRQANDEAEQAARAGGQALNVSAYAAGGGAGLDPDAARTAAAAYLAKTGDTYTVQIVNGHDIEVHVTIVRKTHFLWMVGKPTITATGTGRSTQLFGS